MSLPWRAATAGAESVAAACAALNLTYFLHRLLRPPAEVPPRRAAALVLALVSLGALVEGAFVLAWVWSAGSPPLVSGLLWAAARSLPIAGTAGVSALIMRRLADE